MAKHSRPKRSSRSNTPRPARFRQAALIAFCAGTFAVSASWGQEVKVAAPAAAAPAAAAPATTVQAVGPDGKPVVVKSAPAGAKTPAGQPQPGQPQPGQKPGEQKPGEQKSGEPAITQRPATPEKPANPDELKVRPDAQGKVRFTFNGQPWPAVLEWLATISNMSLDWQELPGDFLNLTTRQAYTVPEARDLINRHLFARGFTILQSDEVLSVVNIKKIDPGVVPRISPAELATRNSYDYVKVSFPLDWMLAETAAEELKPMISPSGKLNALKSTNRLEVMDVVINLRDVARVLKEEQSVGDEERLVREFPLQHARASEVVEQLTQLLGVESKGGPKKPLSPQEMQMQQQQAQMRMQMMQQQQQQGGAKPKPPQDEAPISLVVNTRKNSVLASAPPDKMKIIEQAVKALDVESQGAENLLANLNRMQVYKLSELDPDALSKMLTEMGLLDPITTVQVDKRNKSIVVYGPLTDHLIIRQLLERLDRTGRTFEVLRLRRLEADQVAGTVEFMINGGSKNDEQQNRRSSYYYGFGYYMQNQDEQQSNDKFRVDADVENNQLILWANPVEMEEVRNLLAKLGEPLSRGGGGNSSTVRVLNVAPGEDTAAALERLRRTWPMLAPNQLLMPDVEAINGGKEKSDAKSPSGRSASRPEKNEEARGAKTNATSPRPSGRGDGPSVVPIDRSPAPAIDDSEPVTTAAVIAVPAVLHRAAPTTSAAENPATPADSARESDAAGPDATNSPDKPVDKENRATPEASKTLQEPETPNQARPTGADRDDAAATRTGSDDNVAPIPGRADRANGLPPGLADGRRAIPREPPPVNVTVGANGELIITSPDTAALDIFEEMVKQLAPARPEYKIFYLKYASAFNVAWNLEDYFQIDKKKDDDNRRPYYYFYDDFGSQNKDETRRLSKRRELTFISDTDTNTILVTGADPTQLKTIEELIKIYDRVEPPDSRMARMTTVFTLKYSKAKVVGEAVKDVYRDLLSSNDRALQQQQQGGEQNQKNAKRAENVYITNFGGEEGEDPRGTQVRFKGKLSIGIDELSNTLIVSTEGENLMNNVANMINSLDAAAKPSLSRVHVMNVNGSMDTRNVRRALARAFMEQQTRGQPQQQGAQQQQQQPGQNGQQQPNGQGPQFQQFGNPQQE